MDLVIDWRKLPGYAEAEGKECEARDFVWSGCNAIVCGEPIRIMTVRDWRILAVAGNPYVVGGDALEEHDLMLLWWLSPMRSDKKKERASFCRKIAQIDAEQRADEISEYIELIFLDSPPRSDGPYQAHRSSAQECGIVDRLAFEYGWTDEHILSLPLPRAFQLLNRIDARKTGENIDFHPLTDKIRGQFMAALNEIPEPEREAWLTEKGCVKQ